jgi:hypothetical protein
MVAFCFHVFPCNVQLNQFKSVVKNLICILRVTPSHTSNCHVCRMYIRVFILNLNTFISFLTFYIPIDNRLLTVHINQADSM